MQEHSWQKQTASCSPPSWHARFLIHTLRETGTKLIWPISRMRGFPWCLGAFYRAFSRHIWARARWYYLKTCISCENERIPTPFPSKSYVQAVPFRKGNKKHVPKGVQCVWRWAKALLQLDTRCWIVAPAARSLSPWWQSFLLLQRTSICCSSENDSKRYRASSD